MTYTTDKTERLIPPHGGYRKLESYKNADIVYEFTLEFCDRYVDYKSRTKDQMEQAARSGVRNIAEGSQASGTSKKTELKLVNVARASLEELLGDYETFLKRKHLQLWDKEDPRAKVVRALAYRTDKTYTTYMTYMDDLEKAANCMICLINQANYLLDRQLQKLDQQFLEEGGFTERLYKMRKNTSHRSYPSYS